MEKSEERRLSWQWAERRGEQCRGVRLVLVDKKLCYRRTRNWISFSFLSNVDVIFSKCCMADKIR